MTLRVVLLMALAAFAAAFALQNAAPVSVTFIIWKFESSLALVLVSALMLGALTVAIVAAPAAIRKRWELASRDRRIAELSKRLEELEAPGRPESRLPG